MLWVRPVDPPSAQSHNRGGVPDPIRMRGSDVAIASIELATRTATARIPFSGAVLPEAATIQAVDRCHHIPGHRGSARRPTQGAIPDDGSGPHGTPTRAAGPRDSPRPAGG